jgi:hypothetical protein
MAEMKEILLVRQNPGEPLRRWFHSVEMDLTVWCDDSGSLVGFQLCYDRPHAERGLTWTPESGFLDAAIDDGENNEGLGRKSSAILIGDGHCDANRLHDIFLAASQRLPEQIAEFVAMTIRQHPNISKSMLKERATN